MRNKIKTLVILTPGFPEHEGDSTCIPPQQVFVKALKETNPALNIIVLTFQYPFFSRTYQWHGIKVISFGSAKNRRPYRWWALLRIWATLQQLHKDYQLIGLLSFWLDKCAFMGNAFSRKYQLPHYCWLLGQDAKAGNKYFRRIKPAGKSLVAISDFIARELNRNYGVLPHHIIPVGVNTAMFDAAARDRDIDILGAGSLIPLKQYAVFLTLVKQIRQYFPAIKTVICGDGPEMGQLQSMVRTLDIADHVSLIGRQPHAEVLSLMQRSKILLHPSNYEGFSTVCLEALYAGANVISFIRPMDKAIANWHIASSEEEMLRLLKDLLAHPASTYERVLPYSVQDNARAIARLFGQ